MSKEAKGLLKPAQKKSEKAGDVELGEPMVLRVNFYRDNYRILMVVCLLLALACWALLGWLYYARTHKPASRYFVTTTEGALKELFPLTQPILTNRALLEWVVEAGTTAYNYDFQNYQTAIGDLKRYFTPAGYENFLAALRANQTLESVASKKLVVFAVPTDTPVIIKEGVTSNNVYAWQVQLPLLVTYQSASDTSKQNLVLTMLIAEMPTTESPKGLGIAAFNVRD